MLIGSILTGKVRSQNQRHIAGSDLSAASRRVIEPLSPRVKVTKLLEPGTKLDPHTTAASAGISSTGAAPT